MTQVLNLDKPRYFPPKFKHHFLQELIRQFHLRDSFGKYRHWPDELVINQFIIPSNQETILERNIILDPLNQYLVYAFYSAIGTIIEIKTGHSTEVFVHLRSKQFSSATICCGGVLVLSSLIWGYRNFGFLSLQELIKSAEISIGDAITKASKYFG